MSHCQYTARPLPLQVKAQLDEAAFPEYATHEHWNHVAKECGEGIFQDILHHLARLDFSEAEARRHFDKILDHYADLQSTLGRPVGLRTAVCDYFLHTAQALDEPVLVESVLLRRHEEEAATDELTKLPNRRAFERELEREAERSTRNSRPFSLLMLDVDNFKRFNDLHGHSAGDDALRHVARQLSGSLRCMDMAARFGGEEFAVILPETTAPEAMRAAERFRMAVAAAPHPLGPVTVSIGSASYPHDAGTPKELVASADRALYKAKHLGRNRVALAGLEMRRFPRKPMRMHATCRSVDCDTTIVKGATVNMSLGGMLLESNVPLLAQRLVLIFLDVAAPQGDQSKPLTIAASPVHHVQLPGDDAAPATPAEGTAAMKFHTGMRFLGVDDSIASALNDLLPTSASAH